MIMSSHPLLHTYRCQQSQSGCQVAPVHSSHVSIYISQARLLRHQLLFVVFVAMPLMKAAANKDNTPSVEHSFGGWGGGSHGDYA